MAMFEYDDYTRIQFFWMLGVRNNDYCIVCLF